MEKQYNEELVMNLVKALENALPEGMNVLVSGSAEPSDKELALIIHQLSGKLAGTDCDCGRVYGSREDWIPCDDEDEAEEDDWDCEEEEEEEPHANMERIREMLEDIAELVEGL